MPPSKFSNFCLIISQLSPNRHTICLLNYSINKIINKYILYAKDRSIQSLMFANSRIDIFDGVVTIESTH